MSNNILNNDDEPIVDINITPFVDIVLVLLVIFMVTAHFITNRGMNVQLPKASTAEALKNQKTFHVAISKDSQYMLDGKKVTLELLKSKAQETLLNKQKLVVTISADQGVIYSSVVSAMDALRSVGVSDFSLQLESNTH